MFVLILEQTAWPICFRAMPKLIFVLIRLPDYTGSRLARQLPATGDAACCCMAHSCVILAYLLSGLKPEPPFS